MKYVCVWCRWRGQGLTLNKPAHVTFLFFFFLYMEVKEHTNDSKDTEQSGDSSALLCVFVSVDMLWN